MAEYSEWRVPMVYALLTILTKREYEMGSIAKTPFV